MKSLKLISLAYWIVGVVLFGNVILQDLFPEINVIAISRDFVCSYRQSPFSQIEIKNLTREQCDGQGYHPQFWVTLEIIEDHNRFSCIAKPVFYLDEFIEGGIYKIRPQTQSGMSCGQLWRSDAPG